MSKINSRAPLTYLRFSAGGAHAALSNSRAPLTYLRFSAQWVRFSVCDLGLCPNCGQMGLSQFVFQTFIESTTVASEVGFMSQFCACAAAQNKVHQLVWWTRVCFKM